MKTFKFLSQGPTLPFPADITITFQRPVINIDVPESLTLTSQIEFFKLGWTSFQAGTPIHDCPYVMTDSIRMWEYGWTEAYNNKPTHGELFHEGYEAARLGYPANHNPWGREEQRTAWNNGWEQFILIH